MRTAVKPLLLAGAASMLLVSGAWAETTVLDIANKQNAEKAAVAAQTRPVVPTADHTPVPAINSPSMAPVPVATKDGLPTPTQATPAPAVATAAPVTSATGSVAPPALGNATTPSLVALDSPTGTASDKEVPPQVQAVVDKLRGAKIDLSLEDMNQARAALARLDLLLELEQKMHDLQEARAKHDGATLGTDISGLLPTQVAAMSRRGNMPVMPTPLALPVAESMPVKPAKPRAAPSQYEVQRIIGLDGSYSALLKSVADTKTTTVKAGDTLSDGSEVVSVTPKSIKLRDPDDGKTHVIAIENVSALSGGRGAH